MAATTAPTGDLAGWGRGSFTGAGRTSEVLERGEGPGVLLIPEVPGVTPEVLGLADHLVAQGFRVLLPSIFGEPGHPMTPGYTAGVIARLCVSAEFRAFATNAHRPITDHLRALAADLGERTGGPVGVIGMCFTGGFALALAVDEPVAAAVVSQPGVPFPVSKATRQDPGLSRDELCRVVARAEAGGVCALGLRFSHDSGSPAARFATLKSALGVAFEVIELDSSPGNEWGIPRMAHSVLTNELREMPGHPTLAARDRVVAFLRERLSA
ncbi:dienelactone hydrolase family protein [Frondihabitans australicus]|uniref:Dienelactone hydrolase n=1 Tax=Frondihabitans australicus TaxID=386892 RepID=A0A495IF34_9MICO|nr:dienelactone hydrolase family protein [Frondihabitans australicus]RKR74098.1 dienelactone hydrolase [Frondihabitans australicus]